MKVKKKYKRLRSPRLNAGGEKQSRGLLAGG